jgi:hypothetical protein
MPSTFTSLIVFVLLIVPGASYVAIRQRRMPHRDRSVFRETVTVAVASLISGTAVLCIGWLVTLLFPSISVNISALIENPKSYLARHYTMIAIWLSVLTLAASAGASFFAWIANRRPIHPSNLSSWGVLFDLDSSWVSGTRKKRVYWWMRFIPKSSRQRDQRKKTIQIECQLEDGTRIIGFFGSANTHSEDLADRDLILHPPIKIRLPDAPEYKEQNVSAACVSARRISTMLVSYLSPKPEVPNPPPRAEIQFTGQVTLVSEEAD